MYKQLEGLTRVTIHKSLTGNDLSDTNHFGGIKDSVLKQASFPKGTSESSLSAE